MGATKTIISKKLFILAALFPMLILLSAKTGAEEANSLMADIDRLADSGSNTPDSLTESIIDQIKKDTNAASALLLPIFSDPTVSDNKLAVYVWAIGFTKDAQAVDKLIPLAKTTESELVESNCLRSLASIGNEKCGEFLLSVFSAKQNEEQKFEILNLLAEMQYTPALDKTRDVLKLDFHKYYWQSIFIFGKMGDKSVPFLLKQIKDKDKNVRANAIIVLGQWLIEPDASSPFRKRYWAETETEIRQLILSSLERISPDLAETEKFFKQVTAKEKVADLRTFAQETLNNLEHTKEMIRSFKEQKRFAPTEFQAEYDTLFESAGKKGNYTVLLQTSTLENEPKLEALRQRILQRNSDEAFHDYQTITETIMFNRFISN